MTQNSVVDNSGPVLYVMNLSYHRLWYLSTCLLILLSSHFLAAIRQRGILEFIDAVALLIGAINTSIDNKLFSTHVKCLLAYRGLFPCS